MSEEAEASEDTGEEEVSGPTGYGDLPAIHRSEPDGILEAESDDDEGFSEEPEHDVEALEAALGEGAEPEDVEEGAQLTPEAIEEMEIDLNIGGEAQKRTIKQLKQEAELRIASHKRFDEAHAKEQAISQVMQRLQTGNPNQIAALLHRLGHDPVELAETWANQYLERAQMTPEQREMADFKRKKALFERQQQEHAERQRQAKIEADIPRFAEKIQGEYNALMTEMGIPDAESVREGLIMRVSAREQQLIGNGIPPQDVFARRQDTVQAEWQALQAAASKYVSGLDPESLTKVVGEDRLAEIRQARLSALPDVRRTRGKKAAAPKPQRQAQPQYQVYSSGDADSFKRLLES